MSGKLFVLTASLVLVGQGACLAASDDQATGKPTSANMQKGGVATQAKMWQAEEWVIKRTSPWLLPGEAVKQKEKHKGPVRSFTKAVVKGTAKELGTSFHNMGQDMMFVFSANDDYDPYEKGPPVDKPCIVLKFNLVDATSTYLRRFPDGSYCMEDGFVDGTVLIPESPTSFLIKYPNGAKGRMVRQGSTTKVYRPDKTVTTISKTPSGGYSVRNSSIGYMGEARPDRTGVHYELGEWN